MPAFEFAVELTVPDNTAFTVLTALRALGYRDLERVERVELLRLRLHEGAMSVDECGRALMRAEVVFNPNKHRMTYAAGGDTDAVEAVVAEKDDDSAALSDLLAGHFGVRGLEGVERATAWRLYDATGAAPKKRLDWACRELLANPFSQTYSVRKRPTSAPIK